MRTIAILASALLLSVSLSANDQAKKKEISKADYERAENLVDVLYQTDPGIKNFLDKSYAYAIYPKIQKGAVIVGGAGGSGLVYKKKLLGYALCGYSELEQATIGLQLGGQSFTEIVFFENEDAFKALKKGKFELSGQMSAVALKKGAASSAVYKNGVAIFTFAQKGLMGELSVGGQKLTYEHAEKK